MKILDGKKMAQEILEKLALKIKKLNRKLKLAVIQVGENPVFQMFVGQKEKACEIAGIDFGLHKFDEKIEKFQLKKEILKIVKEPENSGVVIQLPLPEKFGPPEQFLNLLPREKDIDVLSSQALGKFCRGVSRISPAVVSSIFYLLNKSKAELKGKNVVIVGAGRLVSSLVAIRLLKEKATISVLNELTKNPSSFTKGADILISGVGKPNLIKGSMVKKGVIVLDAGTTIKNGKLTGDVDFESVSKKAGYLTPVPGGVGPLTVACLLENLFLLNQ